ncbi:MAG: hypothetical protein ABI665_14410 [Vicinamibacterales bacterium]
MADVGLVRKRVKAEIEHERRVQSERRARAQEAGRAYELFLNTAVPAFRMVANVLTAEGVKFETMTPSGGVMMVSERQRDDGISLELDSSVDPPEPLVTVTRTRGSRSLRHERRIKGSVPMQQLSEDDVIEMLLEELRPWLG